MTTRASWPGAAASPELQTAARHLQHGLALLGERERVEPTAVAEIVAALVRHLRSWRPESVAPLDAGFVPTEEPPGAPR